MIKKTNTDKFTFFTFEYLFNNEKTAVCFLLNYFLIFQNIIL